MSEFCVLSVVFPAAPHHKGEKDKCHNNSIVPSPTVLMEDKHHIVNQEAQEDHEAQQVRPYV